MRILYTTTIGITMRFFKSFIKELIDEGHVVDIATNEHDSSVDSCYREWGCKVYQMSWERSPASSGNINAISTLNKIVSDGQYDIVHCHTPIASACTRLACRKLRKNGLRVIYTAHGFHFYKGAPLKNWAIYYPIERLCSRWTDVLITINKEDFALAKKRMKARSVEYVPGVGVDVEKFANTVVDKSAKRREIGVPDDAFLILSVGELNENKNHQIVIKAITQLSKKNIYYVIAGQGDQKKHLEELANQLNVKLILLGLRTDVAELYKISDCFVLPSFREGLNVSTIEAMSSGLLCVVSNIRGNVDLIDEYGGVLCNPFSEHTFAHAFDVVLLNNNKLDRTHNIEKSLLFSFIHINEKVHEIYGLR